MKQKPKQMNIQDMIYFLVNLSGNYDNFSKMMIVSKAPCSFDPDIDYEYVSKIENNILKLEQHMKGTSAPKKFLTAKELLIWLFNQFSKKINSKIYVQLIEDFEGIYHIINFIFEDNQIKFNCPWFEILGNQERFKKS